MLKENKPVIIDNGASIKAGIAGDSPTLHFQNVLGKPKNYGRDNNNDYFGDEVRDYYILKYPINEHSTIKNWEDMEKVWNYTFKQLNVDPKEHAVLLTENPLNTKESRDKMIQIMFEKFETKGLNIAIQGVLSLYASGKSTGVVLDAGEGESHILSIIDGRVTQNSIFKLGYAGQDLTEYLSILLSERGYSVRKYQKWKF